MGYLKITAASVLWALSGPFIRMLERQGLSSWDIVLGRALFSASLLGFWVFFTRLLHKETASADGPAEPPFPRSKDVGTFLLLGFLAVVLAQSTYFYAISQISLAVAVTLNYTAPFFVMVISYFAFKTPVTKDKVLALCGALAGVALVSGFVGPAGKAATTGSPVGVLVATISGAAYGLQIVVYKEIGRKFSPVYLNLWMMAFGFVELTLLLTVVTRRLPPVFIKLAQGTPKTWLLLSLMALGPGLFAFLLFAQGISKVDAGRASIVAMCEPVAACLLGYFLLEETLTLFQVLGIVLVVGSVLAISLPQAKTHEVRFPENKKERA